MPIPNKKLSETKLPIETINFPDKAKYKPDQTEQLVLRVQILEREIHELKHYIKNIFDGHVLINGRFVKI